MACMGQLAASVLLKLLTESNIFWLEKRIRTQVTKKYNNTDKIKHKRCLKVLKSSNKITKQAVFELA